MQTGFDAMLERRFGPIRKPLAGPGPEELSKKSLEELLTLAAAEPRSYWVQMALGRALRKAGDADPAAATRAFEAAASLVPLSPAPRNELAQIALEKKDRTRAIAELEALVATDFDNVEAARGLATQMRQANVSDVAKVRAVNERIVAIDPFDGEAHATLGRLAMERNDFEAATRDFKVVLALNPIDRAAAHTDLAASYLKSGKTADAKKQTLAALEIAPSYTPRAGAVAGAGGGEEVIGRGAPPRAVRLAVTFTALILLPLAAGRSGLTSFKTHVHAQLSNAPDDRYAGLQWRFVRIKYHYVTEGTATPQEFAGEPWFIDGPAAEQNLSRRVKTATAIQVEDPIVIALDDPRLFRVPVDLFRRAGHPAAARCRGADPARVPPARRLGDVRRFSRAD